MKCGWEIDSSTLIQRSTPTLAVIPDAATRRYGIQSAAPGVAQSAGSPAE